MDYFEGVILTGMLGVAIFSFYSAIRRDSKEKRDQNTTKALRVG